jgi:hypothetical protein
MSARLPHRPTAHPQGTQMSIGLPHTTNALTDQLLKLSERQ